MSDDELRAVLARLAVDDPVQHSYEGLNDGCFYCAGDDLSRAPIVHDADCPWVQARRILGLPLGARHAVAGVES